MGSKAFGDRYNRRGSWRTNVAPLAEVAAKWRVHERLMPDLFDYDDIRCPGNPPAGFCASGVSLPHPPHIVRDAMGMCLNCRERYPLHPRVSTSYGFCSSTCEDEYERKDADE